MQFHDYILWALAALGGGLMWAVQTTPQQVVSNASAWATAFGVKDQPVWLRSENADRAIRHIGLLIVVTCAAIGAFQFFDVWKMPPGPKIGFFLGCAVVVGSILWNFFGYPPPSVATPVEVATAPASVKERYRARPEDLEFNMILIREFANTASSGSSRIEQGQFGAHVIVEFFVMHRTDINAEFYAVHIPKHANASAVMGYVLQNYKAMRDELAPPAEAQERAERQGISIVNPRLPFTGKIFAYHETDLTVEQQTAFHAAAKEKGVVLEFRGPQYVMDARKKAAAYYSFPVEK